MKSPSKRSLLIFFALLVEAGVLSAILIASMNQYYPNVGMDLKYFIPRLIDSYLHYRVNGFSVQWYTPSFGGGLPSYPNPQQIQFSLPQFFSQFVDPYKAILISYFGFILIGTASSYLLFKKILGIGTIASLLSGVFFLANGFYFQHAGIGHLTFITLPLLPLLIFGISRRGNFLFNGVIIGLVMTVLLHHGSFYLVVYFALSAALSFALIGTIAPAKLSLTDVIANLCAGLVFAVTLSASKLAAVLSFLRLFPRHISDEFNATLFQSLRSVPTQLIGSMTLRPLGILTGASPKSIWDALMTYSGSELPFWELDISVTPIVWALMLFGAFLLITRLINRQVRFSRGQWISLAAAILLSELIVEFIIARGIFYPILSKAPILSSLHVNPRYTVTLLFPFVLLSVYALDQYFKVQTPTQKWKYAASILLFMLAIAPLAVYFEMPMDKLGRRQFYVEGSIDVFRSAQLGETFSVRQVAADMNDARVFDQFASNLNPYEVLFGYNLGEFDHQLVEGSPYIETDGVFNFNNPAALVFPEANDAQPFDRVKVEDRAKLDALLNRQQPDWNLPPRQIFADRLSLLSALASVLILIKSLFAKKDREEKL